MAFTDVEKVRMTIGLIGEAEDLLTDEQIEYFLTKNNNNIDKACISVATAVLFQLAQYLHERTASDLEIWGHTWYENYAKALDRFINSPSNRFGLEMIRVYAGGVFVNEIRANVENPNIHPVIVDSGIPKDNEASLSRNTQSDVFDPYKPYYGRV